MNYVMNNTMLSKIPLRMLHLSCSGGIGLVMPLVEYLAMLLGISAGIAFIKVSTSLSTKQELI